MLSISNLLGKELGTTVEGRRVGKGRRQKTEYRRQNTGDRRQRTEGRGQKAERTEERTT